MAEFPGHYRDLAGMQADGLTYSSPSDIAVKMYDALVHQAVYHYEHPTLGGWEGTCKRMFEADPDFAMGHIMTLGLQCFGTNPDHHNPGRRKLREFTAKVNSLHLTAQEKLHLEAANQMAKEDLVGAMETFERILAIHPLDPYALHMAYFLALTTGHTSRLRDTPLAVVQHYTPGTPFHGNVHGKLSLGHTELGEFQAGELEGRKALDHCRVDNWSHHALAHNFLESDRALQGSLFMENTEEDWLRGHNFSHHLWWHSALFQVALGRFEEALTLYDQHVGPLTLKAGSSFPLSDAAALLMRLHMEGVPLGDRAQELARAYGEEGDNQTSLFYDGHMCFASLLGGDRAAHARLMSSVEDFLHGERGGWNKQVTASVGLPLLQGITHYFEGDFTGAVASMAPVMPEVQSRLQGSKAQKDVFLQLLLSAAVKSGSGQDLAMAQQLLATELEESGLKKHTPVNQRVLDRVLALI